MNYSIFLTSLIWLYLANLLFMHGSEAAVLKSTSTHNMLASRSHALVQIDTTLLKRHAAFPKTAVDVGNSVDIKSLNLALKRPVVELGLTWTHCGEDGSMCNCKNGVVRFGRQERWISAKAPNPTGQIQCSAQAFGHDPYEGKPKECWCQNTKGDVSKSSARVAIVTRSNRPQFLITWINYHLNVAGIEHVYINLVADEEQWQTISQNVTDKSRVTVRMAKPANYFEFAPRENKAVNWGVDQAEADGMDWLLHFDDDEYLYSPTQRSMGDIFGNFPEHIEQVSFPNVEALFESDRVQNCFEEAKYFNMNAYTYVAYANGKSGARVVPSKGGHIESWGPHVFRRTSEPLDLEVLNFVEKSVRTSDGLPFGAPVLLIHVESCPFDAWLSKYTELAEERTTNGMKYLERFPFQTKSVKKILHCKNASSVDTDPLCSDSALREFWSKHKVRQKRTRRKEDIALPIQSP